MNKKIVIIGGGIGGLSAAYYIKKHQRIDHEVILIDQSKSLGGRIKSHQFGEVFVDFGGKYLLESNTYALNLCEELGLNLTKSSDERIIITDRKQIMLPSGKTSFLVKIKTYLSLLLKYKKSLIDLFMRSKKYNKLLNRFYEILYSSNNAPEDLNNEFERFLMSDARTFLLDQGFSQKVIDDFFNPFQRGIYMQNLDELAAIFVVLLLGAFDYDLLVIEPSNRALIDKLVEEITPSVTINQSQPVVQIVKDEEYFIVKTDTGTIQQVSDIFLATTYNAATNIEFIGFSDTFNEYISLIEKIEYHSKTYKFFVQGEPRDDIKKNLKAGKYHHINDGSEIYTIENVSVTNSLQEDKKIQDQLDIFLVTSCESNPELERYFTNHKIVEVYHWKNSYPHYTKENWAVIDKIKRFERENQDLFSNISISTNNYITTIETSIKSGYDFASRVSR